MERDSTMKFRGVASKALRRKVSCLRDTVSTLCHTIWNGKVPSGKHLWTIPVDIERDFDVRLSDAIDELECRREEMGKADLKSKWDAAPWEPGPHD